MINNLLKAISLALTLLLITPTQAQIYQKFPTNVRYIGGGYNNVRPFFKTLEAALNDVKPLATASNPYAFWLASDSLWVADWDSVFTTSGLTMKDSIDIYYVTTGKIKWMPFGLGGSSGSGTATIITQDDSTLHYKWPAWNQSNVALPIWQRKEGMAMDSIDEEVWRLIVYTKNPLYIENDTLRIDTTGLGIGDGVGWTPDTTTVVRTAGDQTISGNKILSGTATITGNLQIPGSNVTTGIARHLWGSATNIYYSGSGASDDSTIISLIDYDTKHAIIDTFITSANLAVEAKDYFVKGGIATFTLTNTSLSVTVSGVTTTSVITAVPVQADSSTAVNAADNIRVIPYNGGFHLKRGAGGTSALKVNWAWIKR